MSAARWLPRTLFGQFALVIALVLAGAALLAALLGRELATRPAAQQLLRAMDGFANVVEELDRRQPRERTLALLHEAGLETRDTPPPLQRVTLLPLLRELDARAPQQLGQRRELHAGRAGGRSAIWLKLDTAPSLWVSFTRLQRGEAVRRFSIVMLAAGIVLVWLAAAWLAGRLVRPLRQLTQAAPGIARGDPPPAVAGITREVAELADALDRASAQVRDAGEERALMLAGVSHDLRTPLTRLQYALELIPDADPALRAGMERDIEEMDAVLGQFVAYARDGRDEHAEPLDLADLCRNAATAAPGDWTLDLPDSAPMRGRPMALLRAVGNLMANAGRHGQPPFVLSLHREGRRWLLEIADHGAGLNPEAAARARQPFVRSGAAAGSGLGLAIVERVAHQHGGTLELLPNTPQGLRAVIALPAD